MTCLALLLMVGAVLSAAADSAAGARPVKGALYGDNEVDFGALLYLRVSKSGRWLNPQRSVIDWNRSGQGCGGLRLQIGSRRHPVRLRRGGRFRFVHRRGGFVFRMRGRFVTRNRAKLKVRYRREPARAGRRRACDDDWDRLRPRQIVHVPFRNCRSDRAKTLLLASTGRVFRQLKWSDGWERVAYACLFSVNRPVKLGVDEDGGGPGGVEPDLKRFRLVGPYVAYLEEVAGAMSYEHTIVVRDLRSGTRPRRLSSGYVPDLELKGNGSFAWIEQRSSFEHEPATVRAADSLGVRQLDSGNIAGTSLTLNGSTLTWIKDGVVRSATLY